MQDSGVDGPHTTGMHRTSYRPHTLSPDAPAPGTRFFFFFPLSPSLHPDHISLSLSLISLPVSSFSFLAAFFLLLTSYHSGRVNGFGRLLGLPSANLVSLGWDPGFLTGFPRRSIGESVDQGKRQTFPNGLLHLVTWSSISAWACR